MKRSVRFGLIGLAGWFFFNLTVSIILLIIGFTDYYYAFPHPMWAHRIEGPMLSFFMNSDTIALMYGPDAIFILLLLLMLLHFRFVTKDRLRFWSAMHRFAQTLRFGWMSLVARLLVAGGLLVGAYFAAQAAMDLFVTSNITSFLNSYLNFLGYQMWAAIVHMPTYPIAFTAFALAHMLVTYRAGQGIGWAFKLLAAGAAVVAVTMLGSYWVFRELDGNRTLKDIPGLSGDVTPRSMYILTGTPKALRYPDKFDDWLNDPLSGDVHVAYNEHNERVLLDYLKEKPYSSLRFAEYNYLYRNRLRRLDIIPATRYSVDELDATANYLVGLRVTMWFRHCAATDESREILDRLADESAYFVTGKSAMMISQGYARFGEIDKAWYWYRKGLNAPGKPENSSCGDYVPPSTPPFAGGVITGRVAGVQAGREVSAGVFPANAIDWYMNKDEIETFSMDLIFSSKLIAGGPVGPDGSFRFSGLSEGECVLLLSLPDPDGKQYSVKNPPGVITITDDAPTADVGEVRLVLDRE